MRYHDRIANYAGNLKAVGRINSLTIFVDDRYEMPGFGYSVERVSGLHGFHAYCIASAHSAAVAVTHISNSSVRQFHLTTTDHCFFIACIIPRDSGTYGGLALVVPRAEVSEYPPVLFVVYLSFGVAFLDISSYSHTLRVFHNYRQVFNIQSVLQLNCLPCRLTNCIRGSELVSSVRFLILPSDTAMQRFLCLMSLHAILDVMKRDLVIL